MAALAPLRAAAEVVAEEEEEEAAAAEVWTVILWPCCMAWCCCADSWRVRASSAVGRLGGAATRIVCTPVDVVIWNVWMVVPDAVDAAAADVVTAVWCCERMAATSALFSLTMPGTSVVAVDTCKSSTPLGKTQRTTTT